MISVVGDVGTWPHSAGAVATAADSDVLFVVGDFSYGGSAPEEVWCDFMKGVLGDEFPIELLAGNHESDSGDSGFVRNYTSCLPDRLGSVGDYGVQYSLDLGPLTFIGISPDLKIDKYTYTYGEGTPERAWLENAADAARASGDWVMIGLHKLCISVGYKSCQTGEELANWMVANADVIVSGHEHTYERTRPLQCVTVESYDPACVSDEGTIWVINGTGGRNWWVKPDDPEASYFASVMGNARRTDWGYGTSRFVVTEDEITGSFLCSGTCSFTDSFVISR